MTTDQKHSSDGTLNEPEDTRRIEKIAKLFGLDEQNIEVYKALFGQIWELEKKSEDYYSKYKKLKRRVNLLKAEIEDLDKCIDKETLVDLIQEMVPLLIIRKYKKRGLLCEPLNRSDSSLSDSSSSEDSETIKCYYPKKKVPQRNQVNTDSKSAKFKKIYNELIFLLNKQMDGSLEDHVNEPLSYHPIKKFRRRKSERPDTIVKISPNQC
ncbi:9369_t:CDS:1 [Racocetra persica]|uniref:9369_t:CDS:1 n=1 Tax=Racocetra persica TaxID=160502 RepID=A0ACA9L845_9GLOM|nr:9369_t:CDS:1 [Racocetra persica]